MKETTNNENRDAVGGSRLERIVSCADSSERIAVGRGEYRLVRNSRRKRKLSKRGESIWWSPQFDCWLWDFASVAILTANDEAVRQAAATTKGQDDD